MRFFSAGLKGGLYSFILYCCHNQHTSVSENTASQLVISSVPLEEMALELEHEKLAESETASSLEWILEFTRETNGSHCILHDFPESSVALIKMS